MKKSGIILVVVFSTLVAACSGKPPTSQDRVDQGSQPGSHTASAAQQPPNAERQPTRLDCSGKDDDKARCLAFAELDKAHAYLDAYAAGISLDLAAAQYKHGKRGKGVDEVNQTAANNVEARLSAASSVLAGENDPGINTVQNAIEECVRIVDKAKSLSPADYDLHRNECTLRSARLLQSAKLADNVVGVSDSPDFNKLHWGDSIDVVQKEIDGAPSGKSNSSLTYHGNPPGK